MSGDQRWDPEVAAQLLELGEEAGGRRGLMFGYPAVYAGRKLAACAYGNGVGMKLPPQRVEDLVAAGTAEAFQPYGKARMRAWVWLPADGASGVPALRELLTESLRFVAATGSQRTVS